MSLLVEKYATALGLVTNREKQGWGAADRHHGMGLGWMAVPWEKQLPIIPAPLCNSRLLVLRSLLTAPEALCWQSPCLNFTPGAFLGQDATFQLATCLPQCHCVRF